MSYGGALEGTPGLHLTQALLSTCFLPFSSSFFPPCIAQSANVLLQARGPELIAKAYLALITPSKADALAASQTAKLEGSTATDPVMPVLPYVGDVVLYHLCLPTMGFLRRLQRMLRWHCVA